MNSRLKNLKVSKILISTFIFVFFFLSLSSSLVSAQGGSNNPPPPPGGSNSGNIHIENPLTGNIDSITEFVQLVVNTIVIPIGSVVVVFVFIYAGFLFVTAQGNETKIKTAKSTFWWAVIGTAILLGSWVLAEVIQNTICRIAPNTPNCFVGPPAP